MASPRRPNGAGDLEGFTPIFLANLLPLAGVVWLEWEPATLVLVYGLEVLFSVLLASVKALFAGRPPSTEREGILSTPGAFLTGKRGSFRPVGWLPPIYPRNAPFALGALVVLTVYGVFFGGVVVVAFEGLDGVVWSTVAVSVLGLAVAQLVETGREYFGNRRYERVSPYAVIETPARQLFVLLVALAVVGLAAGLTVGGPAVLAVVVCVKLLAEWSTYHATHTDGEVGRLAAWLGGPGSEADVEPVEVPETPPGARVRPARIVVLEGVALALVATAVYALVFATVWGVAVLVAVAVTDSVTVLWLGVAASPLLVVGIFGVRFAQHSLEYATLEYQRRDDSLVVYDRVLEEPQWTVPIEEIREVTVVQDRLIDRLAGTRTFAVTTGWGSSERVRRIGPFEDPDGVVPTLDVPLESTALEPMDRRLAAGAITLACVTALAGVAVLGVSGPSSDGLVVVAVGLLGAWTLWDRAYPETDEDG